LERVEARRHLRLAAEDVLGERLVDALNRYDAGLGVLLSLRHGDRGLHRDPAARLEEEDDAEALLALEDAREVRAVAVRAGERDVGAPGRLHRLPARERD